MKIEIWSDVMCPFCYIGKRRLEAALKGFAQADQLEIEWKSFLLNPNMATDPDRNTLEYLSETKGWSMEQTLEITRQVVEMAAEEGLEYHMEQTVVANSFDAHRLIQLAKSQGKGDEMEERLFKAYFTEGVNIADFKELSRLASEIGLNQNQVDQALIKNDFREAVLEEVKEAGQLGISGVPFFVFDRKYGISGAQPVEAFEKTLQVAWEAFQANQPSLVITSGETGGVCDSEGNCD
ncbi:DsbA family oxidoreductase [Pararhodonellum marinum]|uniref:DsbA family oxidoreductase n=1 Tax=Pararhodonellum marinum TaxID=2755358 RepID=UPI00188E2B85|nr:DsbA family oxidoreductase [Pararhodonellum marinum]